MSCSACDSIDFGPAYVDGAGIIRWCSECGYAEEAPLSEVARFVEDNSGWPAEASVA